MSFPDVGAYIASFPEERQVELMQLRNSIRKAAPHALEKISYGMPYYEWGGKGLAGRLIYFAAFKKHISVFIPNRMEACLPEELAAYHVSKATYQFPSTKPFPFILIEDTVTALVQAREARMGIGQIHASILEYHRHLSESENEVGLYLGELIQESLPMAEAKVWHGHPVWFLEGNPIVGYHSHPNGMELMFWSGASFEEAGLRTREGKFKDASVLYTKIADIQVSELKRWLLKSQSIQWDYKNLAKRKGKLERLK